MGTSRLLLIVPSATIATSALGCGRRLLYARLFKQHLGHHNSAIFLVGNEASSLRFWHDHESLLYVVASRPDLRDTSRLHQQGRGTELVDGKKPGSGGIP